MALRMSTGRVETTTIATMDPEVAAITLIKATVMDAEMEEAGPTPVAVVAEEVEEVVAAEAVVVVTAATRNTKHASTLHHDSREILR